MADLTPLTLIFEFMSPLIVTLVYLVFFGKRSNKFIEAFIALMYVKTITFFLFWIIELDVLVVGGFDAAIGANGLSWLVVTDFVFQFTTTLQEYLTWIMVAFFAVLFGMVVLAVKLTLQDPITMRFKKLIGRQPGSVSGTDVYTGLRDRLEHITFEGVKPQPLDPEVQSRAWRDAWKDYLVIGMATIVPSIFAYNGGIVPYILYKSGHPTGPIVVPNVYVLGVLIFLTWIYRFGYPASNRLAKSAGLKLGDRDLGGEMMRGVLGWFFRLNIILSLVLLFFSVQDALTASVLQAPYGLWPGLTEPEIFNYAYQYFFTGLIQAFPPILFAIIILPLAENFVVHLYKKTIERFAGVRRGMSESEGGDALEGAVASVAAGFAVTAAFIGAVMGITLSYAHSAGMGFTFMPGEVDLEVANTLVTAGSNSVLIAPTIWILLMLAIPFASMLLLGVLGNYVRSRIRSGLEGFAFLAGLTVSVLTWISLPGIDYLLNVQPTPAVIEGLTLLRVRPIIALPDPGMIFFRLAYQFIVNVPIYISTVLFVLYFFEFRKSWRDETGDVSGPLLHIREVDIIQAVKMFFCGLLISIIGVWLLTLFIDPGLVGTNLYGLFAEIGNPNGLERVFEFFVGTELRTLFWLYAEHNFVRTLIMIIWGPLFWSAILWVVAVRERPKGFAYGGTAAIVMTGIAAALWTQMDLAAGVFVPASPDSLIDPWVLSAHLGFRAAILYGFLLAAFLVVALSKALGKKGIGGWWFPLFVAAFALEYFIYDDQFSLIALVILPMIIAIGYKGIYRSRPEVRSERLLLTYVRFSFMSIAIAEVLSTALIIGGISIVETFAEGTALPFLAMVLPHAIVEIPAFLMAAAVSIRIAKDLGPNVQNEDWETIPSKTRSLISDSRTWRTYALIMFFLLLAALIEAYITPIVYYWVAFGLPPPI